MLSRWILVISILLIVVVGVVFFPKSAPIELGVFYPEPVDESMEKENQKISILVFGDMMLDRKVFLETKKTGDFNHPFLLLNNFLQDADLTLANLESPITNYESISNQGSEEQRMKFTMSLDFLEPLVNYFSILGLANNHMQDFGEDGYEQTKEYLSHMGIDFFGDLKNRPGNISKIIEKDGIKIGFIGHHSLYHKNLSTIIEAIRQIKQEADFIIIFTHWGEEYKTEPTNSQQEEAKEFIDAGADLVLGGHPHVIQPIEIYEGKFIFYSLGNFIFDQFFSQEITEGLAVRIYLEKNESEIIDSYELFPYIINKKSQPELTDKENKNRILNELSNNSIVDQDIKEQIKRGFIE